MTATAFRRLALGFPGAIESSHMDHPDFRRQGRIFATLGSPDDNWGMLKLTPAEQTDAVRACPAVFRPCTGAWGRGGATLVFLPAASAALVGPALAQAWEGRRVPPGETTRS